MTLPKLQLGIAAFILRNGHEILLGKRLGSHGAGTWASPGGHVEPNETTRDAIIREVREETGIQVYGVRTVGWGEMYSVEDRKRYVTLYVLSRVHHGTEAQVLEPEKCAEWRWFDCDDLPQPLFKPLAMLASRGIKDMLK